MSILETWRALRDSVVSHLDSSILEVIFAIAVENFEDYDVLDPVPPKQLLSYLRMAAKLENGLLDNSGPIIGLFQFSEIAWLEAGSGDWKQNAFDPAKSTRAALRFFHLNRERYRRQFSGVFTNEIAYLYHNQGPSAARHFLMTGELRFPMQSLAALEVFNTLRKN